MEPVDSNQHEIKENAMTHRLVSIVALSALLSSVCLYATFGQNPEVEPDLTGGAIRVGAPPSVPNALGRYQLKVTADTAGNPTAVVIDTHTGHCWMNPSGRGWRDWGSPVRQK